MAEQQQSALDILQDLISEQGKIRDKLQSLDTLLKNDSTGRSFLEGIHFKARNVGDARSTSVFPIDDKDLAHDLVAMAKHHYTEKLGNLNLLIGLAEQLVHKELGPKLEEMLRTLRNKE